jgi:glycogen operon protein
MDWDAADRPLLEFTAALARLRRDHPTFRRRRFFEGRPVRESGDALPDIAWLRPDGTLMRPEDWGSGFGRAIGVFLNGAGISERDRRGEAIRDRHFIVLFNAGDDIIDFHIPVVEHSPDWEVVVDTSGELADSQPVKPGEVVRLEAKSTIVLSEHPRRVAEADHSVAASLAALAAQRAPAHAPSAQVRT